MKNQRLRPSWGAFSAFFQSLLSPPNQLSSVGSSCDNTHSNLALTCSLSDSLSYTTTNSYDWSQSIAESGTISSSTKFKVASVTEELVFSFTASNSITNGHSNSESVGDTATATGVIVVPPFSKYSYQ